MIRFDDVRERIEALVPALAGSLGNAGDFATLVANNQLPQTTPAGFVLHGGLAGGSAAAATGLFIQNFKEMVFVVLVVRVANDPTSGAALDEVTPLVRAVIEAIVGWGPEDAIGIFELSRGELIGSQDNALIYQIDFSLDDQLRINPI